MTRYAEVSNNTLINCGGYPFFTTFWIDATIKNNIFYNVLAVGEDENTRIAQDPDGLPYSMINIDTLANEFPMGDPSWLERESERSLVVKNNYYGWDDEVAAIWAGRDTVFAPTWMNERTLAFFADDENYPLVVEEKNATRDDIGVPSFITPVPTTGDFVKWIDEGVWGNPQTAGLRFVWEPEGAEVPNNDLDWLPLEDLRLTDAAYVVDDGLPMGDLNWYSKYAERWDMTGWNRDEGDITSPTAVKDYSSLQSGISLGQIYPNPFTNETRIVLSLDQTENVNVSVYDIVGKRVNTLMSGLKTAGNHELVWDGTNSAGVDLPGGMYVLRLETDSKVATARVIKQK